MNLGELQDMLDQQVQEKSFLAQYGAWINNAILELAADFELPALKLLTPTPLAVDTSKWLWPLPENFQKKLFRCAYIDADGQYRRVHVHDHIDALEQRDMDHDEIGNHVSQVATAMQGEDQFLGIFPLAADTLPLWFYRKPLYLDQPTQTCDCIPPAYHHRVIFPKSVIKAYQFLQDQVENFDPKPLQYWHGELQKGLYGSPQEGIGLINYLAKSQGGPRRTGGRDPVGWRPYRYGY
jgi:hypothetical protein